MSQSGYKVGRAAVAAFGVGVISRGALVVGILTVLTAFSYSQDADAQAAGDAARLQAEVISVRGTVQKLLPAEGAKWTPVASGDMLEEKTLIRTGTNSECVLKFADRGEVTVKSLTKSGIGRFLKSGNTVQAEVGLKYGAVHADVDSSKGKNDFRVRTAGAVVALRGSGVSVGSSEMGPSFRQSTGNGQLTYGNGTSRWLNPGAQQTDGQQTPGELVGDKLATWLGDVTGGLTPDEQQVINDYFTGGNPGRMLGGFGEVAERPRIPDAILSSYTSEFRTAQFTGSGTFTDPAWSVSDGSGGYGKWIGSGMFRLDGEIGSWHGIGIWRGVVGSPTARIKSFAGKGTWQTDTGTGTFLIAGTGGPPDGAHFTTSQGTKAWAGYGPVKILKSTQSP